MGDKGYLESSKGDIFYILNTRKENNLIVHQTKTIPEKLEDSFTAVVDEKQRSKRTSALAKWVTDAAYCCLYCPRKKG